MSADEKRLLDQASAVRDRAYARYSDFSVGAALVDEHGDIYTGCNVENASFPLGACAEANAIGAMVAAGGRRIVKIAVVGGHDEPVLCLPCGGCRQRIAEFADEQTEIIVRDNAQRVQRYRIETLLPQSFKLVQAD